MKNFKFLVVLLSVWFNLSGTGFAADFANSLVGAQGYDLVSYHQNSGPVRGSGNHTVFYNGISYIFATDANKKAFQADPKKYLPAYGGYCAYGVSVGKKIISDPLAWKIVNGTLYLNLNNQIQEIWSKDINGYIKKANDEWPKIINKDPESI
ncbi:YHS domain-containing (seleno)protein [Legionella quateirensis]|uniref:YHS domain n=1 Tax=Legionella quateirensis TaxID=45072 RepID=A0A378KXC2_9GAMM|nr:YHS domain-containing (seleno)protein [Legionella quateirensis]KTD43278.1 YHS domain protein [Legionella quateirensis]STY18157.1 YHS domain [Legionella quateirensis]